MFPTAYQPGRKTLGYRTPTTGRWCHTQLCVSPSYRSRPPAAGRRGTCFPGTPSFAGQRHPQRRQRSCLAALPVFRATRLSGARHTHAGTRRRPALAVGGCLGTRIPGTARGGKRGNERAQRESVFEIGLSISEPRPGAPWQGGRPKRYRMSCIGVADNAARGRLDAASRNDDLKRALRPLTHRTGGTTSAA